jgi:hypothetical protein
MSFEYFLDAWCDSCCSNFQSNSYQGIIDIVRWHLHQTFNICKVENMKISLGIKELDLCAFFCFATSARKVVFGISNSRIESNNNIAIV